MKTFNSKVFTLNRDILSLYHLVSNPSALRPLLEKVSGQVKVEDLQVQDDSVRFRTPGFGDIAVTLTEKEEPNYVKYTAEKSPVPIALLVHLTKNQEKTDVQLGVEVNVPPFMEGMVGGRLRPMLDKVADALAQADL